MQCNYAQNVTVYIADGVCHSNVDDATSFKVTLTTEDAATITTYNDTYCNGVQSSMVLSKKTLASYSCLRDEYCTSDSGYGCATRFSVGGLGGPPAMGRMTSYAMYDNKSCSPPALTVTMTRELSCTSQSNHSDPVCEDSGIVHYVKDCTRYNTGGWDDYALIYNAFGWNVSYLLVEEYESGWCDSNSLINATAYVIDGICHANAAGTTSTKFTIGHSLILTTYEDPDCNSALNSTGVTQSMITYGQCIDSARRFYLGGPGFIMTAVAVYEDDSCSETPVGIKFTRDFVCGASQDPFRTVCGSDGATLYSISSCTYDYAGLSSTVFGNNTPYIVVEEFSDMQCNYAQNVTVYIADGVCHSNVDDATSFKVTLATEDAATITTYNDTYCNGVQSSMVLSKKTLASYSCLRDEYCTSDSGYGCATRFSVGGFDGTEIQSVMKAVVLFDDKVCSSAPVVFTVHLVQTCVISTASSCQRADVSYTLYQETYCVDELAAFAATKFGSVPYLIMESYAPDTNCQTLKSAVVYKVDGKCYPIVGDGTYFKIAPGFGSSLTIATYPTSSCSDFDAEYVTVGTKFINTGKCFKGSQQFYANMSALFAPSPPPMIDVESLTREQIMFPEWLWEPAPRRIFQSD
ncbi:hypothetical protein ON010_g5099 [Phytophthora cinnamomi]|nr:hypothetical protein ON010_g5099 [Phytophthora cinnamomi]